MFTYRRSVLVLPILACAGAALVSGGCEGPVPDDETTSVEQANHALYGAGDSVLTVVKQNINFNGSTAPKYGTLGLTAYSVAPQWYMVTVAPNGPYQTACPPFHGGDTPQSYNVYVSSKNTLVTFAAPLLDAPSARGTCTLKTSIVFYPNPANFFGQPQISIAYAR